MKKILAILTTTLFICFISTAHADFFSNKSGEWKMGPSGPYWDESDWPEWTPMYWMEEFMDSWDDDDNTSYYGSYGSYGNMTPRPYIPYSGGYGIPQGGYPYPPAPYGYQAPAPIVPPATPPTETTP